VGFGADKEKGRFYPLVHANLQNSEIEEGNHEIGSIKDERGVL
jgi:hypothetical protein